MTASPTTSRRALCTGIHLPNYGPPAANPGVRVMAALIEQSGFDSIWLSDHVVLVDDARSAYPFSRDGKLFQPLDADWFEWTVTAGYIAAVTEHVDIGVGVAVAPLRHPLLLAKQAATIDRLSGGRLRLGLGVGWLTEEITALGGDPTRRGAAVDEAIRLMGAAWTGRVPAGTYGRHELAHGVHCRPVPVRDPLPVYIGGGSRPTAKRVARFAQGWYGAGTDGTPTVADVLTMREAIRQECQAIGRDPGDIEVALRVTVSARQLGSSELAERLASYVDAGVDRLCFDIGWKPDVDVMRDRLAALLSTVRVAVPQS